VKFECENALEYYTFVLNMGTEEICTSTRLFRKDIPSCRAGLRLWFIEKLSVM